MWGSYSRGQIDVWERDGENYVVDWRYQLWEPKLKAREVCWLEAQHIGISQLHWHTSPLDYIRWHFQHWICFHIQANTNSAFCDVLLGLRQCIAILLLPLRTFLVWTGQVLYFSITFVYSDILFLQWLIAYCGVSSHRYVTRYHRTDNRIKC
jgi:hypothetical protein